MRIGGGQSEEWRVWHTVVGSGQNGCDRRQCLDR
jgi:hypothetical protein